MELIDTHCHLTSPELSNRLGEVLDRARRAGVCAMISVGTDAADSMRVVELAGRCKEVFAAVGIHPHAAARAAPADLETIAHLLGRPRVVAVGEIGLDYHYEFSDRASQRRLLAEQLQIAARASLPVILHCRDAYEDAIAILLEQGFAGRPVVFHCFTGSQAQADAIAEHGWLLSFAGIVTFRNAAGLRALAARYAPRHWLVETDAPYLSPEPVRTVRPNEPAHLVHTVSLLAELRGLPVEHFAHTCTVGARMFFRLDTQPRGE